MADDDKSQSPVPDEPNRKETMRRLRELIAQAETAVASAEEANRKANSESGYAYNAKQNAEDHAKAIAQVKGTVDADFTGITTTKKNAEEAAQAIQTAKASTEANVRTISESKAAAVRDAAAVTAANARVANLVKAIEQHQETVTTASQAATTDSAAIATAKAASDAASQAIQTLQAQVTESAAKSSVEGAAITKAEADARKLLASLTEVSDTANAVHRRVTEYETQLRDLKTSFTEIQDKIEGLLPGATSAGLASAFRDHKARFNWPQLIWAGTFAAALAGLLGVAMIGSPLSEEGVVTWDAILRHLVGRLPYAVPFIWLALVAGRHYTLALRLQEDYAYKEAVSTVFEGYKREMKDIPDPAENAPPSVLVTLCNNVLETLGQRPGRIYEGRHEDITPFGPIEKLIKKILAMEKKDKEGT